MSQVKTIQTAADKSAKSVVTATLGLDKVVQELVKQASVLPELIEKTQEAQAIYNQQEEDAKAKLAGIADETKLKVREAKVELDMQVRENESKVLDTLLAKNGLAHITKVEVDTLNQDLVTIKSDNAADIQKAVKAAVHNAESVAKANLDTTVANHKVAVAQKDADIKAKDMQIGFMQKTIDGLEATIRAERAARVDIANAEAQRQGVVVNTSSK